MSNGEQKQWLDPKGLAEFLSVRRSTVYSWISERRVPYHKVPGSQLIRFNKHEIDEWLSRGRVQTVDEHLAEMQGEG